MLSEGILQCFDTVGSIDIAFEVSFLLLIIMKEVAGKKEG